MSDLDDLACFVVVVRHNGFTAAARATGIDKTRLSRRLAALERRLGVSLLQRNAHGIALTKAGQLFYSDSLKVVESAEQAYDSIAVLRQEPAGAVRVSSTHALAASHLPPLLAGYLALYPKVHVELELSDAGADLASQRFDIALRCSPQSGGQPGMVVRTLGGAPRVLLASRTFLDRHGRPDVPERLSTLAAVAAPGEVRAGLVHWRLLGARGRQAMVSLKPRLQTCDVPMQLAAVAQGLGVASVPAGVAGAALYAGALERVLPQWRTPEDVVYALHPGPRGMLPSVRSLLDYLVEHFPANRDRDCAFAL